MLESFLFKIKDHRRGQGRRYQLGHILFFAILAILGNATSYRKVHAFIKAHYETLDQTFGLNWKRVPAYTTIRALIQETSASELEASFREYSAALAGRPTPLRTVAFDGKTLRGSFDHFQDQKAIQVLSAFLTEARLILAHEEIARKTNEIPTAQALITKLVLRECLFTFDALHCQEKTLEVAKATGNEVLVQVKGNQKGLLADCQTLASTQPPAEVYTEAMTKAHNRIEQRSVTLFRHPDFQEADKWHLVEAVVKVERKRWRLDTKKQTWIPSHEIAYYIATTAKLTAATFGQAIRAHWEIENGDHCVRDVTLGEDQSRIRTNPHIFAKLRSFALNILRPTR